MGCFGSEKSGGTTVVNQTSTATPTPEEAEMQKLQLDQYKQIVGPQTEVQKSGLNLVNQLLLGQTPTSPLYQQISGVSPEAIGAQATEMTRQNLPGFQSQGILDSGTMYEGLAKSIANQLLFPAEQFNVGAKQNLLNLALSGQAQVQQPVMAGTNTLAGSLAGLRSMNTTGTTTQQNYAMNPFLKSFQTSFGERLGSGTFGNSGGWWSK